VVRRSGTGPLLEDVCGGREDVVYSLLFLRVAIKIF
jgi:hypothetical protein